MGVRAWVLRTLALQGVVQKAQSYTSSFMECEGAARHSPGVRSN